MSSVSVGGFLGMGNKLVAVPCDRLQLGEHKKCQQSQQGCTDAWRHEGVTENPAGLQLH